MYIKRVVKCVPTSRIVMTASELPNMAMAFSSEHRMIGTQIYTET